VCSRNTSTETHLKLTVDLFLISISAPEAGCDGENPPREINSSVIHVLFLNSISKSFLLIMANSSENIHKQYIKAVANKYEISWSQIASFGYLI
jgi:hypothetical protein